MSVKLNWDSLIEAVLRSLSIVIFCGLLKYLEGLSITMMSSEALFLRKKLPKLTQTR
jgi:hypothetical protein